MDIEKLSERIKQLEAEMNAYVEQANRQIAMQQGAIAVLRELIQEATVVEEPTEE